MYDAEARTPFSPVSAVLVIGGAHYSRMNPELKGLPILLIPNTVPEAARVEELVRELNEKWAAFERKSLIHVESEDIPKLGFRRFSEEAKEPRWPMKRHEY